MANASPATVLGNFADVEYERFGFRSRFFKKGDQFWVETDGPKGVKAEYRIEYTFGVEPLQQYLIRFPDGRLQVLGLAWDTERKKWFSPSPNGRAKAGDPTHWTSAQYTWNFMCAECHSTDLKKNYDPKTDRYATTFNEVNVACEACHGPGSLHLQWVRSGRKTGNSGFEGNLRGRGPWTQQTPSSPPRSEQPTANTTQVETCARCHSRRSVIAEPYEQGEQLAQSRTASVLEEGLYHADGQIDDEVFEYGSFVQSKMFHKGVVCTDCHDAHTARLKVAGDNLCLSCHLPERYADARHSHHRAVSCVECHMPGKVYMGNDLRHDHSIRIPRPDLSTRLKTPNACNRCHQDHSTEWAAAAFEKWYGTAPPHYGEVIAAARAGDPRIRTDLAALVANPSIPEIVRATAVGLSQGYPEIVLAGLKDPGQLVRRQAVRALSRSNPADVGDLLAPLATDPVRAVRVEVGRILSRAPGANPSARKVIDEFRASLELNSDRAESQMGLAELALSLGDPLAAEASLRKAIELSPETPEPYVNLADFLRGASRDEEGRLLLERALGRVSPAYSGPLHHALGLLLIRSHSLAEGTIQLRQAAQAMPDDPGCALAYALALDAGGKPQLGVKELERALRARPFDPQILAALVSLCQRSHDSKHAQQYLKRLGEITSPAPER